MLQLLCRDIMSDGIGEVVNGHHVDMVFTDPPWNRGIARIYSMAAKRLNTTKLNELYSMLALSLKVYCPDSIIYVMIGFQGLMTLNEAMTAQGYVRLNTWDCLWRGRKAVKDNPFHLCRFTLNEHAELTESPGNGNTAHLARWAMNQERPKVILDPFIGRGSFISDALGKGITVLGMDFNAQYITALKALYHENIPEH